MPVLCKRKASLTSTLPSCTPVHKCPSITNPHGKLGPDHQESASDERWTPKGECVSVMECFMREFVRESCMSTKRKRQPAQTRTRTAHNPRTRNVRVLLHLRRWHRPGGRWPGGCCGAHLPRHRKLLLRDFLATLPSAPPEGDALLRDQ